MAVALLALAIALGGTAYAANRIGTNQIKNSAVTTAKIKNKAVTDAKLANFDSLGSPLVRIVATDGPDVAAARAAAPRRNLYRAGPLRIYAKCFRDTGTNELYGEMYAATTRAFSIMEGSDTLEGGAAATDYLNPNTPEVDRQIDVETVSLNATSYGESENMAAAPNRTAIMAFTAIGLKNGAVAGDGPFGPGNACIFQGVFSK
jgi:hypothetical protein